MKNQSGTIKTNLELYRVVKGGSGGYRRLPGGSDDFSLQTNRQTLIIIYISPSSSTSSPTMWSQGTLSSPLVCWAFPLYALQCWPAMWSTTVITIPSLFDKRTKMFKFWNLYIASYMGCPLASGTTNLTLGLIKEGCQLAKQGQGIPSPSHRCHFVTLLITWSSPGTSNSLGGHGRVLNVGSSNIWRQRCHNLIL